MTSQPMRDPKTDNLLTPQNCALVIIDVQPLQITSVASMERRALVDNITSVCETAKIYRLPVVLSTVNANAPGGQPTIHQVTDVFPELPVYDRSTLNAWEDKETLAAIKATGRKKLIMVAVWTEVCLAYPALDAMRDGYEVYPVVDAVGGTSVEAHRAGLQRIFQAGAQPITWSSLICELQRDWGRVETVPQFVKTLFTVEGR